MNRRCASKATSNRASSPSIVSASWRSSSGWAAEREPLVQVLLRDPPVAAVIVRKGRSTRPAITQPSPAEITTMIANATPDSISSWCSSLTCSSVSTSRKNSVTGRRVHEPADRRRHVRHRRGRGNGIVGCGRWFVPLPEDGP